MTIDFSGCPPVGWLRALFSVLDSSLLSVPRCDGESEWHKVETFHVVQIHSSVLPILYILALEFFLCMLNANPVLHGITLPGLNTPAYTDGVTAFVKSNAEIDEVGKEISRYEEVCGLAVRCVEGSFSSRNIQLDRWASQDTWRLVWPDLQLEKT